MNKFIKSTVVTIILAAAGTAVTANAGTMVFTGPLGGTTIVSHVPAVSEAGTLPLMAVGLGLIALRLRRKSK